MGVDGENAIVMVRREGTDESDRWYRLELVPLKELWLHPE